MDFVRLELFGLRRNTFDGDGRVLLKFTEHNEPYRLFIAWIF